MNINDEQYNDDFITQKIFFGKYKPEKKIGEGSFGKVFSGIDIKDKRKYAFKIVIKYN